jgi:hypothetical protein
VNVIGCDLPTCYQVVAWIDEENGEIHTGGGQSTLRVRFWV